jgi:excisionase family DNA binding protein
MQEMHTHGYQAAPTGGMLTTREVQALIKVDKSTIYRMAETGRIPAVKVGRQWRFPEARLHAWLQERGAPAPEPAPEAAPEGDLRSLLPGQSIEVLAGLLGDVLGTMVIITDMQGQPLSGVANPCGLFGAVRDVPGVMEKCMEGWQELGSDLRLEPAWSQTHLGFLCARSLVRIGDELQGMVIAGGVARDDWPPGPDELQAAADDLGVAKSVLEAHVEEVFHLSPEEQARVLTLLPRIGALISHMADDRGRLMSRLDAIAVLAGGPPQRSTT